MSYEEAADWRTGMTTQQRFAYMFDEVHGCEVKFLVGQDKDREVVSCHKFPLIAGSAVFENILENESHHEIKVPDMTPPVFKTMIKYLYGGELDVQASNVLALMRAGDKYRITEITEKCGDFLKTQIKADNVCTMLDTSIRYSETSLTEKCLEFILENASEALAANDWTELSHEALMMITASDQLYIKSETILYEACMKWADAECERRQKEVTDDNRREVLGDALFQIRFPTMTHEEFAEVSCLSELLTGDECRKLFEHIIRYGKYGLNHYSTFKFNKKPRYQPLLTFSRFDESSVTLGWGTLTAHGDVSAVGFQCNKMCAIVAVSLYGGDQAGDIHVSVELNDSTGFVLSTKQTLSTDGSKTPVRVDFPYPVAISAYERYSIVASVDCDEVERRYTYYGGQGSENIANDEGLVVNFFDSSHALSGNKPSARYGKAEEGQIPDLYFIL